MCNPIEDTNTSYNSKLFFSNHVVNLNFIFADI